MRQMAMPTRSAFLFVPRNQLSNTSLLLQEAQIPACSSYCTSKLLASEIRQVVLRIQPQILAKLVPVHASPRQSANIDSCQSLTSDSSCPVAAFRDVDAYVAFLYAPIWIWRLHYLSERNHEPRQCAVLTWKFQGAKVILHSYGVHACRIHISFVRLPKNG